MQLSKGQFCWALVVVAGVASLGTACVMWLATSVARDGRVPSREVGPGRVGRFDPTPQTGGIPDTAVQEPATGRIFEAWVAYSADDFERAKSLFLDCTRADPKDPSAWRGLGRSYLMLGDREAAVHALNEALSVDREDTGALLGLGQAYLAECKALLDLGTLDRAMAQLALATKAWEEALRIEPDLSEANQGLVVAYIASGDWAKAIPPAEHTMCTKRFSKPILRTHLPISDLDKPPYILGDTSRRSKTFAEQMTSKNRPNR